MTALKGIVKTTIGLAEVMNGQQFGANDLTTLLCGHSLEQVTDFVSRVSLALLRDKAGLNSFDHQLLIATAVLPAKACDRIAEVGRADGRERVIFHDHQLLVLLKSALGGLSLQDQSRKPTCVDLAWACLLLNDLMAVPALAMMKDHKSRMMYMFANYHMNTNRNALAEIGRTFHMMIEDQHLPLDVHVKRSTGLALDAYWFALNAFFAFFRARAGMSANAPVFFASDKYLQSELDHSEEEVQRMVNAISSCASDTQAAVRDRITRGEASSFDVFEFERAPLIRFGNRVYCPCPQLLLVTLGISFRHKLLDPTVFTQAESRNFLDAIGSAFERHATSVLDAVYPQLGIGGKRLRDQLGDDSSVADYVVPCGSHCLVFECKSASPVMQVRHAANWESLERQIRDYFVKSARQLTATAGHIMSGRLESLGVSATARVVPIIVTMDFGVDPILFREIIARVRGDSMVSEEIANSMQVFDVRDLEYLERIAGLSGGIVGQLVAKLSNEEARAMSLANHIAGLKDEVPDRHNSVVEKAWKRSNAMVEAYIAKHARRAQP